MSMNADERRQRLSEFLAQRGFVELPQLTEELGVSESTVRRDLTQLETEGLVRRTHGGAVFVSDRFSVLSFAARESSAAGEKAAIGRTAAELVEDNETVLIDGGTTTFQMAKCLAGRPLQIVTNSLPIANLLGSRAEVELLFVGGYIYPRSGVALGPMATEMLAKVHVSKAFMGAAGIAEDGLYNANMLMAEADQQMMKCADEVIVVADHTKFGKRALARLAPWSDVDRLVSDEGLDDHWRAAVEAQGVPLILASMEATVPSVEEERV